MSSRVSCVALSMTASDGQRPPGKMYVWIQLTPRRCLLVAGVRDGDRLEAQSSSGGQRVVTRA